MKKLLVVLFSAIFVFSACSFGKNAKEIEAISANTEKIAKNNFRDNYDITYNKSYDSAVITKRLDPLNPNEDYSLKIMIYDIKNNKVLWGKKAGNGSASWRSKNEVLINYMNRTGQMTKIIYNLKKNRAEYP